MTDIVARLRKAALKNLDPTLQQIVIEAADVIEHLRSVAGAVSRGPELREIKRGYVFGVDPARADAEVIGIPADKLGQVGNGGE